MTTDTTTVDVKFLALKLANLAENWRTAPRPVDKKVAKAALEAGASVANILGYGHTPSHVEMTVLEFLWKHPRPEDLSAGQRQRKEWVGLVETYLSQTVLGIKRD